MGSLLYMRYLEPVAARYFHILLRNKIEKYSQGALESTSVQN